MKKTVLLLVGTRPEVIKMAPVYHALKNLCTHWNIRLVSTGQHREMLRQSLTITEMKPDLDLKLMTHNQSLSGVSALLFQSLDRLFLNRRPDLVIAQGDTVTVQVAALVCFYSKIPFGHVEAGLRTGDLNEPFPEELNRIIADKVADYCFAPTKKSKKALLDEGISKKKIFVTGNTVIDSLNQISLRPFNIKKSQLNKIPSGPDQRWVLITAHRRESFGLPLSNICQSIKILSKKYTDVQWVFPVHLNPNVQAQVQSILQNVPRVHLLKPMDYPTLIHTMKRSTLVLTDSGGIQEEAPSFGVPVLVLRKKTERPEGIEARVAFLVGIEKKAILTSVTKFLNQKSPKVKKFKNPYGDGNAGVRIARIIKKQLGS